MKKKITWKTVSPDVGPRFYIGYIGKIRIFTISKSLIKNGYYMRCGLPDTNGCAMDTIDIAKSEAEAIFEEWLKKIGIKTNGDES